MMQTAKALLVSTLKNDAAVVSLLGGQRVYFVSGVPDAEEFPRITYHELSNIPALRGDGREIASEITFAVDIWVKKASTTALAAAADNALSAAGFVREFAGDIYEEDLEVNHKSMRYSIKR